MDIGITAFAGAYGLEPPVLVDDCAAPAVLVGRVCGPLCNEHLYASAVR